MTTRAELRESLRNVLSDRSQWRDTLVAVVFLGLLAIDWRVSGYEPAEGE